MIQTNFQFVYFFVLFSMLLFCGYAMLQLPRTAIAIQYDCRLAEISPDYPQVVKQKCRELMK